MRACRTDSKAPSGARRARWLALATFATLCIAARVDAHEAAPGVVALKQVAPGRFLVRWSPPSPPIDDLKIHFPNGCRLADGAAFDVGSALPGLPRTLICGASGISGNVTFESNHPSPGRIALNVEWLEGEPSLLLSSGSPASVTVPDAHAPKRSLAVLRQYLALGSEHIWFGIDHLLFLLGLLLLVRGWKSVLLTVSSFTVAHSITLALAALDLVSVPSSPVEICIALSVLLLALETTRGPEAWTRRFPWLVAFGFGLLHGLGFASALAEVGLPSNARALALFGFNLGVELGQVVVVGAVVLGHLLLKSQSDARTRIAKLATWSLGTCSVYWLLQRIASWLAELPALA